MSRRNSFILLSFLSIGPLMVGCPSGGPGDGGGGPAGLTAASPAEGDLWPHGSIRMILWDETQESAATVSILLRRDGQDLEILEAAAPNTGSYEYTVPLSLPASGGYTIVIQGPSAVYTSGTFSIVPVSVTISTSDTAHNFGTDERTWTFEVWNSGTIGSTLQYQIVADTQWLAVDIPSGISTGPTERQTITVTVFDSQLLAGKNTGHITISAENAPAKSIIVTAFKPLALLGIDPATVHDFGFTDSTWSFDIWNAGEPDTVLAFNAFVDRSWVTLTPETGTSLGAEDRKTIAVAIDRSQLPLGTINATITVTSDGNPSVFITLVVTRPRPVLSVSDGSFDFGFTDSTWSFEVWNSGEPNSTLSFEVMADRSWVAVSPVGATSTGPSDRVSITVTIDRSQLPLGSSSATLTLTSDENPTAFISLVAAQPRPLLSVSDASFDFGFADSTWSFDVWNSGEPGSILSFAVMADRSWVAVSPVSATSTGASDRVSVLVTIDRSQLPLGASSATLTLTSDGNPTVPITLVATQPRPLLSVSDASFDFGLTDSTWSFDVWNSGEPDSVLSFEIMTDRSWIVVSPVSATSSGPDDRVTVTVTVDRNTMPVGGNGGTITVLAADAGAVGVFISAAKSQALLTVSATSHEFGTTSTTWSFEIWNSDTSGSVLNFRAYSTVEWITVMPGTGTSSAPTERTTVSVTIDRSMLQPGFNAGQVDVGADGLATIGIPISAVVPTPAISLSATNHDFGRTTDTWSFEVWNSGQDDSVLDFLVSSDQAWATVLPVSGTSAGPDDLVTVAVTLNRSLMPPGPSNAVLTVSAPGVPAAGISLSASAPSPAIGVSSFAHDFGTSSGPWTFEVTNSGDAGSVLTFDVSPDKEWILVSPASGASSGPGDPQIVTVTIDPNALNPGGNTGTISIIVDGLPPVGVVINAQTALAALAVSATNFDFGTGQNTASFEAWNSGDSGTTLTFFVSSDKAWLAVDMATATSTGPSDRRLITLTANRSLLPEGASTATVTLTADNVAPVAVTVTATTPTPVLDVSGASFDFEFFNTTWTFDVWNEAGNGSTLEFTVSTDRQWVAVTPQSGSSTGPANRTTVMVTIDRSMLNAGGNGATIFVTSLRGGNRNIPIVATTPAPSVGVSESGHAFGKVQTVWSFDVWNAGQIGSTLDFEVTPTENWISVAPLLGSSADSTDKTTVTVTIDRAQLTEAAQTGFVIVSAPQAPALSVTITALTPQPAISLSAGSHTFAVGETQWSFEVWNRGDAGTTLSFVTSSDQNWIAVSPAAASSADAADRATVTVTIDRGPIVPDATGGIVTILASTGESFGLGIGVLLPAPSIMASALSHDFGSVSTTWSFDVWNVGDAGTTLDFTVSDDQDWLSATPISGMSTDQANRQTIDVTLDRAQLPAGLNNGTIFLTAPRVPQWNITLSATQAKAIFVREAKTKGMEDGVTWETAFGTIQAGVDAAESLSVSEVWVAEGSYNETVQMAAGISIYGGFAGTETELDQRDLEAHRTVIDGQGMRRGVVAADGALLDGFVITGGNAYAGGGLISLGVTTFIVHCQFEGNEAEWGGAVYAGASSEIIVEDSSFISNVAHTAGNAVYLDDSALSVSNSTLGETEIEGNSASSAAIHGPPTRGN